MSQDLKFLLCIGVTILSLIRGSDACNGYSLKVNSAKACSADSIIKIENPGASLDADCNLILLGCVNVAKSFKTAKGTYTLKKAPMPPMEGEMDFCEAVAGLDDPQISNVAKMYNVPTKCPFPAGKVCGGQNKKISVARFKNQLGIAAGTIDLKVQLEHDVGKSCLELNINISKARKG